MSLAWRARRTPPFGPGTDSSTPARVSAWRCLARYGPGTPWNSASRLAGRQTPAGIAASRVQQWTVHSTPPDSRITRIPNIPDIEGVGGRRVVVGAAPLAVPGVTRAEEIATSMSAAATGGYSTLGLVQCSFRGFRA